MTVLLTDDEVVAVALDSRVTWPTPLPSVSLDDGALVRSQRLGLRSLLVRGLLDSSTSPMTVSPEVADLVKAAAASPRWVAAYVASEKDPTVPAGDSTYAFQGSSGWLLDLVSPAGVHQISTSTSSDAVALIVALAKNVFTFGIVGDTDSAAIFIGASEPGSWAKVSKGEISTGTFTNEDFESASTTATWSAAAIESLIAGAAG